MHADLTDTHIEMMPLCAAKYTGAYWSAVPTAVFLKLPENHSDYQA